MKTKQVKEESDKSLDDETAVEPKTRARKKASDNTEDDKNKPAQDEPKTSKETKRAVGKPRAVVKKQPLGIRKALRSKTTTIPKAKAKKVIKQTATRGRKPAIKVEPENSLEKETIPLIPATEIKKEPLDETTTNQPNSRSSSPRTASRRQRLSSDVIMMKSVLADSPSSLVLGPRTSPYSMRSERSNSPSMFEGKNLRSGKPRKVKNNLLNEVVMKEQKKRRRLLSDSKASDTTDGVEDCKKLKRGRSCSRDGSEISKCSDITESDLSMSESLNDTDIKELNKKLDKPKTDLDIDIENNIQISTIEKVPSLNVDSKLAETEPAVEPSCNSNKNNLSLKRSTSLDSDNNNSNRLKIESLNTSDVEDKSLVKTENDTLFEARSRILTSMSKTFNSRGVTKNIRRARRGRRAATSTKPATSIAAKSETSTITTESAEDKQETIELNKKIDDIINNLGQNIDGDHDLNNDSKVDNSTDEVLTKTVSKVYAASKPLGDNNSIVSPETPVKDKDSFSATNENTPSKIDDSENIRLHYEDDSVDQPTDGSKQDKPFKCSTVASIDLLMDRLKEFEEFDKRRQRQESETKPNDGKSVMVSNDVVLIQKSGADIKLKDIQTVKSPERPLEKENVLSCFENNSAISIVKRDQVRKSVDIDRPNTVTLIKRNSISARKESTSSNHSKESDAISIFEKSLGKDVTLTEIRKSVDKQPTTTVEIHQFATLHPNNPQIGGVMLDPHQISITPRVSTDTKLSSETTLTKRPSRKSSETGQNDVDDKMATIEKIKSPLHQVLSPAVSITPSPVAVKSPEVTQPIEAEALAAPLDTIKALPEDIALTSDVSIVAEGSRSTEAKPEPTDTVDTEVTITKPDSKPEIKETEKMEVDEKVIEKVEEKPNDSEAEKPVEVKQIKEPEKVVGKGRKSARTSIEIQASQPGPSNALTETPESQKRKENILRTLGLLTHKAANEAKIEKLKEKERIYNGLMSNKSKGVKSGDYTGTLKTVIKLNRGVGERDKKRYRSSLKMTFQKSKNRAKPAPEQGEDNKDDDAYYTIERREGGVGVSSDGGHRKSHYSNRLNTHDAEAAPEPVEPKETLNLVIPEKASSFSIHPGRLCMDQCFYCGGKFGLFDTPCHIAQMKSGERQKKVLDNEEKLTIDSCLCDACYRHVDRRANCPSYRKRPPGKPPTTDPQLPSPPLNVSNSDKPPSPVDEESSEDGLAAATGRRAVCHAEGCTVLADHSIRRKWLIKMRASVNKLVRLQGDYPGLHTIPLCSAHHSALAPLAACDLCRRRLTKHANVHLHPNYQEINPLLSQQGIPLQFSERLVLCKMCRYYCTLLTRPGLNDKYMRAHTRKLLQICNVEVPPELEQEPEETGALVIDEANSCGSKHKKKTKTKSKQRKSTDPEKPGDSESSEKTESSPEKHKDHAEEKVNQSQPMEEDIESLISSNKILVPGAKISDIPQSDSSEDVYDFDAPMMPVDKQTELQYLLQKQNNPAQFLKNQPNLTMKTKSVAKVQSTIQKPGHAQRVHDKNAKRIQKVGQVMIQKEKVSAPELEIFDPDKAKEGVTVYKNITLNEECTIESIPNKKPADITTLKNKWQMSDSFSQVKKNLSELSKKFTVEKDTKKSGEPKYSNPVKRLETNPSISVRELFPGEEEMNLQCNIEFNSVKGVTPEGWEKCNSTIQYDVEAKKLWTELQRPYGNQSSFLRHLIILEKYFRNGDLVLAQNASSHATAYSDSVQTRLRSYDNVPNETPKRTETSLLEFRKKPAVNGKSLLKTNQTDEKGPEKDPKKFMPPPPPVVAPKKSKEKSKPKSLPPELIAINTPNNQGRKAIQNVLHNIQQLVKGVSASDPTEVAAAPLPPNPPKEIPKEKKDVPKDTPKKQKPTSKPWRPTLMPITQENLAKIAREPTKVAVDGRHLPSLVQVMSSGKRYHITLQDYNKMCVMRREKLQQLHDGDKTTKPDDSTSVVTEIQPSTMLGNGGTLVQNIPQDKDTEKKEMPDLSQISSNAATILKNVGLKNITIAPIPPKTATVTSQTISSPIMTSPSLVLTSTPIKLPQLGPSVSITSETVLTPNLPIMSTSMIMPKIPKSLTVIPQTVVASLPSMVIPQNVLLPQSVVVPQSVVGPQSVVAPSVVVPPAPVAQASEALRP